MSDLFDRLKTGVVTCAHCRTQWPDTGKVTECPVCGNPAPAPRQNRRHLTTQLLGAIEAWEDALTDDERDAQEVQAHALLSRLMTGDVCDALSAYDLRLRLLGREPGDPINLCSTCEGIASWSVWLHTPEWGERGGDTRVLCHHHALELIESEARRAV